MSIDKYIDIENELNILQNLDQKKSMSIDKYIDDNLNILKNTDGMDSRQLSKYSKKKKKYD